MAHGFKTGGRSAGTPNRRTAEAAAVVERMEDRLRAEGLLEPGESCNPIERLILIGIEESTPTDLRLRVWSTLASYLYPKRKALDAIETTAEPVGMATRDARAIIEATIEKVTRQEQG